MRSHLTEIVKKIAKDKGIEISSFRESRIRSIERIFDNGEIDAGEAISQISSEFGYEFGSSESKSISKKLSRL